MARRSPKTQIVAFKVEEELAQFLDKLPNKSEFIRKAIIAQFGMTCPLCTGTGVLPRGLHNHFSPVLAANRNRACDRCQTVEQLPMTLEGLDDDKLVRMEQFFHGGPFYCEKCFPEVPPCDNCGWHVPLENIAEHHRKIHSV
ncbi:hypothetical protein [Tuwongella immobilis]|uniref:Adenylosuccinate lyase: Uncharacterized protein n=1 Tax=Tuwongella immobilis TaxID=692036 RepID=A0A6C2YIN3_9BACT|nr:hypothetical protein [Tuwongella immobilis]VIP01390.1 adenylosuccinate lyase : Uncharacterized protein OS=Spirochaeta sp. L21-RPul-D2 GN=L21SP2_2798 PE=4 SV=1 [Tuwongella immobilis]VTR98263.1 adenylosuccinate lyase : Uncharacterized protein OS=Spirochaeta sp. L21-RPul-D2 GN=L21SP2_2798 PE=4 SV=1 [Tuwongella immobilis]